MTDLLQRAFEQASKLPPEEQDYLASLLLAELAVDDDFDRKIAESAKSGKLAKLAEQAMAEHRAGLSLPLDPKSP